LQEQNEKLDAEVQQRRKQAEETRNAEVRRMQEQCQQQLREWRERVAHKMETIKREMIRQVLPTTAGAERV
jgi:hypothetical protein